jgi:hypothetical protein
LPNDYIFRKKYFGNVSDSCKTGAVALPEADAFKEQGIYFIGFFFAFGFGSTGNVALMSAVR